MAAPATAPQSDAAKAHHFQSKLDLTDFEPAPEPPRPVESVSTMRHLAGNDTELGAQSRAWLEWDKAEKAKVRAIMTAISKAQAEKRSAERRIARLREWLAARAGDVIETAPEQEELEQEVPAPVPVSDATRAYMRKEARAKAARKAAESYARAAEAARARIGPDGKFMSKADQRQLAGELPPPLDPVLLGPEPQRPTGTRAVLNRKANDGDEAARRWLEWEAAERKRVRNILSRRQGMTPERRAEVEAAEHDELVQILGWDPNKVRKSRSGELSGAQALELQQARKTQNRRRRALQAAGVLVE